MNAFRHGLEPLAHLMRPMGSRVLLRAVMATDESLVEVQKLDTRKAVCHEVVAIGPDVCADCPVDLKVGDYCVHISAAGDALDYDDQSARHVFVHVDDIVCRFTREDVSEYLEALRRAANGQSLLVAP